MLMLEAAGARAVLVGSGLYSRTAGLISVPAVQSTVDDLRGALVERCGLAQASLSTLLDPESPSTIGLAVAERAEQARDLLLFYYVGHGLVSDDGQLYLATRDTDPSLSRLRYTALSYTDIRKTLLRSPARSLVVILDCCFSGVATGELLGDVDSGLGNLTAITGGYVLTASGRSEPAYSPVGQRHTAFSGHLLRLLIDGDPDGSRLLTLDYVHRFLAHALQADGLPRPQLRASGQVGSLVLAVNTAWQAPDPNQAVHRRRQIVRPHPAQFDDTPHAINPYKGLASFQQEDQRWFFGRERLTEDLVRNLAEKYDEPGLLAVVGASGSGKSSLLRAGMLPAVNHGELRIAGSATWPCILLTPTADPVRSLADAVGSIADLDSGALAAQMGVDPSRLAATLATVLRNRYGEHESVRHRLVLVVDQFEQLFAQCEDADARATFIAALGAVASSEHGEPAALVVIAIRADSYQQCITYTALLPALQQPIVVGRMTAHELRDAIEKPAAITGLSLQDGLTDVLLAELGDPKRLPLLSHALHATWQHRDHRVLSLNGYRATGGISTAVAMTAERIYVGLDADGQAVTRQLLSRLIHVSEDAHNTLRRFDRERLLRDLPNPGQAAAVLDAFGADDARLLTIDSMQHDDRMAAYVEIAHEALLREWPRLRDWIDADRAGALVQQKLLDDAHNWDRRGRSPSELYRGGQLALACGWADDHSDRVGSLSQEFLDASLGAARRWANIRTAVAATVITLLLMALSGGGIAYQQQRNALNQQREALAQQRVATARGLQAQADAAHRSSPQLALRLGIAAELLHPSAETRARLVSTLLSTSYTAIIAEHDGAVFGVEFSPDRRNLATVGSDGTVHLVDVANPARPELMGSALVDDGPYAVHGATFTPDGRILAVSSERSVSLWDLTDAHDAQLLSTLVTGRAVALAFSPDGHRLVAGSDDNTTTIWDVRDPTNPHAQATALKGHKGPVQNATFDYEGNVLATSSSDNIILWDTSSSQAQPLGPPMTASTGSIDDVSFSPDKHILAASYSNGTLVVWDVGDPRQPYILSQTAGPTGAVSFSPDGRHLATSGAADSPAGSGQSPDTGPALWDITEPTQIHRTELALEGHTTRVLDVSFSPDGKTMASSDESGAVILWDIDYPLQLDKLGTAVGGHDGSVSRAAFSTNGQMLATGSFDGTVILWDVSDATRVRQLGPLLQAGPDSVCDLSFSADGSLMAAISISGRTTLWDVTGAPDVYPINSITDAGAACDIQFSPDGRTLFSNHKERVKLLDVQTGFAARSRYLDGHEGDVRAMAISPDGDVLATAGKDMKILLWDLKDPHEPRRIGQPLLSHTDDIFALAFSADGSMLASGGRDKTIVIWDLNDPSQDIAATRVLSEHLDSVTNIEFSPNGRIMLTSSADGVVILWNTMNPFLVYKLGQPLTSNDAGPVTDGRFAPDERTIVSVGKNVTFWDITKLNDLLVHTTERACDRAGRGFDRDEWARYVGLEYIQTCPN